MKKLMLFTVILSFCSFIFAQNNTDKTVENEPESISEFHDNGLENAAVQDENQNERKQKKYPKMDANFQFYLPSLFGTVTGNNAFMKLRKDLENVNKSFSFMVEVRGDIAQAGPFSFSWAFAGNSYIEQGTADRNHASLGFSSGAGLYFHIFPFEKFSLAGLYLFAYPFYNIPVFITNYETNKASYQSNDYHWKVAWDLGYTLVLLDSITVSTYMRNSYGWTSSGCDFGLDFGIAIGLYFHDPNYYSY